MITTKNEAELYKRAARIFQRKLDEQFEQFFQQLGEPRMIVFSNPGEIDIRAVTMLGVNVKPEGGAIGYFGTGLKYAIAVLLREGHRVEVWSGLRCYKFGVQEEIIRGKSFQRIVMNGPEGKENMSITLEFGKNWKLEGAYRELWSNCVDEKGVVFEDRISVAAQFTGMPQEGGLSLHVQDGIGRFSPQPGTTSICIHGDDFAQMHDHRFGKILLPENGKLLFENSDLQIFHGASNCVYYKGIKVFEQKKAFLYTYNLLGQRGLTEDRTLLSGTYELDVLLLGLTGYGGAPESIIEEMISCGEQFHEATALNFTYLSAGSEEFLKASEKVWKSRPTMLNDSAKNFLFKKKREKNEEVSYPASELSDGEQQALAEALNDLALWGYRLDSAELVVTDNPGNLILGLYIRSPQRIILVKATLSDADKLRGTLIEEIAHMRSGQVDESRGFQEFLLMEIVRLGYAMNIQIRKATAVAAEKGTDDEIQF